MTQQGSVYWDERAVRFGRINRGLPAVCAYGMPVLYNEAIHICQKSALTKWLDRCSDMDVLDFGCGVGRWSLDLAQRGNRVVGVDVSRSMIEIARADAAEKNIDCQFEVSSVVDIDLGRQFDFVIGVTVLQHVMDPGQMQQAVQRLADHVRVGGTICLLEVAPSRRIDSCDSAIFRARTSQQYLEALALAGFDDVIVEGVDIAPLRSVLLPLMPKMPRAVGRAVVTAAAVASLPIDLIGSRWFPQRSWHKLFIARKGA